MLFCSPQRGPRHCGGSRTQITPYINWNVVFKEWTTNHKAYFVPTKYKHKTMLWINLSTARPSVLVFMICASLAWILIIIWKPYRSILILLTNNIIGLGDGDSDLHRHGWWVNTIDGPTKLVCQDAILDQLSRSIFDR